jgi:hypothetical protein
MRDADVRTALLRELNEAYHADVSTRIFEELGLCEHSARIDVAVVNGTLSGYEIKSARDTLERLPSQSAIYSKVFDTVSIVADKSHLEKIEAIVPRWWGLSAAVMFGDAVTISAVRHPADNPNVDAFAVVQLLWRDETLLELEKRGLAGGIRSRPRETLWSQLASNVPLPELRLVVRETIKTRKNWRDDQ